MKQVPKVGTKEHYFQVVTHMGKILNKLSEEHSECTNDLKELYTGLQIINNEYVLKSYPGFKEDNNYAEN